MATSILQFVFYFLSNAIQYYGGVITGFTGYYDATVSPYHYDKKDPGISYMY